MCPGPLPAGLVQKGLTVGRGVGGLTGSWSPFSVSPGALQEVTSPRGVWSKIVPRVLTYRSDLFAETFTHRLNPSSSVCSLEKVDVFHLCCAGVRRESL